MKDKILQQFTPTEQRILALLRDGKSHTKTEIKETCIDGDGYASDNTLWMHMSNLRRKLKDRNETVVAVIKHRMTYYQHFRYISTSD